MITDSTKRNRRLNCTKRLDLLQKIAAEVVSFDFDDTLYSAGTWNEENLDNIRKHLKEGYNVVVVTGRNELEAKQMLEEIGLDLEVVSTVGLDGEISKSDVLRKIGAIKHYEAEKENTINT